MSRRFVTALVVCLLSLAFTVSAWAQSPLTQADLEAFEEAYRTLLSQGEPEKSVQLVYSINPWNGREIGTGTFAVQDVDTIYIMAGHNNLINARTTEVYYWPITREYMADWFTMNEPVEGKLRIRQGDKEVALLEPEWYTDYFPDGASGRRLLVLGEEANELYEEYNRLMDEFFEEQRQYYEKSLEHSLALERILQQVNETGEYVAEDEVPKSPRMPQAPGIFVYKPRTAFVVNLPAGRYQIEMIGEDGQPIPGTQKNLHVYEPRRRNLGYLVRSEHMWTRPFQTNDPAQDLYLEGRRIFYLEPFHAEEYNQYQYLKSQILTQPLYGEGVKSSWMWVQTERAEGDLTLQVLRDGEVVQEIKAKPYWVRQTEGHALGYNIIEFNEDDPVMFGRQPTFTAFRVELEAYRGGYTIQLVDEKGNVIPGSVREIRSIRTDSPWGMYLVSGATLILGLGVYINRRRLRPRSGKQGLEA